MCFKIILCHLETGFLQDMAVILDPKPVLTGSPKQIAWAEKIRTGQLTEFRRCRLKELMTIHGWYSISEPDIRLPTVRSETAPLPLGFSRAIAQCEQALNADQNLVSLFSQSAASFWIDHRDQSLFDTVTPEAIPSMPDPDL